MDLVAGLDQYATHDSLPQRWINGPNREQLSLRISAPMGNLEKEYLFSPSLHGSLPPLNILLLPYMFSKHIIYDGRLQVPREDLVAQKSLRIVVSNAVHPVKVAITVTSSNRRHGRP